MSNVCLTLRYNILTHEILCSYTETVLLMNDKSIILIKQSTALFSSL